MTNDESVLNQLRDHEKRIAELESLVSKRRTVITKMKKNSLTNHLMELRDSNFFSLPRTPEETHDKLKDTYHCEVSRVEVALIRLAHRKLLRKASKNINGKRRLAYVW